MYKNFKLCQRLIKWTIIRQDKIIKDANKITDLEWIKKQVDAVLHVNRQSPSQCRNNRGCIHAALRQLQSELDGFLQNVIESQ